MDSGPGAGLLVALRRGRFRIGRSGTEIVIPDAELSREHARLDVSDSDVTILDLGSANGISVDGRKGACGAPLDTASLIRCGDSSISLVFGGTVCPGRPVLLRAPTLPRRWWSAAPRRQPPGRPGAGRGSAAGLGVGLALLTGMWMFLAFTAVSAVSVLVPVVSGRRQRREFKAAVAEAARRTGNDDGRPHRPRRPVHAGARPRHPTPAEAPAEHRDLWLRLGLAEQSANIRLEPPDSGFRPPPLGQVPLTLDPVPAVVTIHGPAPAVAGLLRSFILQLAAYPAARRTRLLLHGPADTVAPCRALPARRNSLHA